MTKPTVGLFGLAFDEFSSFRRGCAQAPPLIRDALWSDHGNTWTESGLCLNGLIEDCGDVEQSPSLDFAEQIFSATTRVLDRGLAPLCLGGDHSVTFPVVDALVKRTGPVSILHVDAHPDLYDDFEGLPYSHASPFARIMERGLAKRLVQVGIRTLNGHQREQAARFGVEVVEMAHFRDDLPLPDDGPVYVSIDLDGLDPAFAPGVSHPEPGGLSTRDVLRLLNRLGGTLVGADVVEYNPTRDVMDLTAVVAAKFVKELAARLHRDVGSF